MMAKQFQFSAGARQRMLRGIEVLADTVQVTLGPRGRNVALGRDHGGTKITKDGVAVAREIELDDRFEDLGVRLLREVALRASYLAGDGTTTAVVLGQAIARHGARAVAAGMNPMDLKRGIDQAVFAVVAELRAMAREVTSNREIAQIAAISCNGDQEIADTIADAMAKVGHDGVITVEEGPTLSTEVEIVKGIRFNRGFTSPRFATDKLRRVAELADAYVLISEKKLDSLDALLPLLDKVSQSGRALLVIAEEVAPEVQAALIVNNLRKMLKVAVVKAPAYGELRRAILLDIAAMTGGTVISEDLGMKLSDLTLDVLGQARRVTVDKQNTTIIDGAGTQEAIDAKINEIRGRLEDDPSDFDRDRLEERLARLRGGIAVVKLGGVTEVEVQEKKDRIRNAIQSTRAAMQEGILPGGGVALLRAAQALKGAKGENPDQEAGIAIVRAALSAPVRQIASNCGADGSVVVGKILGQENPTYGYDARTMDFGDMIELGIIDATKVVRSALQGAASVAGLLITTEVLVAEIPGPPPPELPGHHDHDDMIDFEY